MFDIDKSINKMLKGSKQSTGKTKEMLDLAKGSIFFPFTQPTVKSPTGRVIKGRMPSIDRAMKNFGLKGFGIEKDNQSRNDIYAKPIKTRNLFIKTGQELGETSIDYLNRLGRERLRMKLEKDFGIDYYATETMTEEELINMYRGSYLRELRKSREE